MQVGLPSSHFTRRALCSGQMRCGQARVLIAYLHVRQPVRTRELEERIRLGVILGSGGYLDPTWQYREGDDGTASSPCWDTLWAQATNETVWNKLV